MRTLQAEEAEILNNMIAWKHAVVELQAFLTFIR